MLFYGLGAHMLPRFTANPIRMGRWPWLQMGLAHAGMVAYATGFLMAWYGVIIVGGVLIWLSLCLFIWRIWPVLWPHAAAAAGERAVIRIHGD